MDAGQDVRHSQLQQRLLPTGFHAPWQGRQQRLLYPGRHLLGDFTLTPSLRYDYVRNRGQKNDAPIYNSPNPVVGHDYSAKTYTGWSPRLSAFWTVNPQLALFADYSQTWRAPVIDEQYEVQAP